MRHALTIAETEHQLWLERAGEGYRLHLGERALQVALEAGVLRLAGAAQDVTVAVDGDLVHVHLDGAAWTIRYHDPVERHGAQHGGAADDIAQAPMPGTVVSVHVADGQSVARGDTLVVIESMKLETAIKAARDGIVAAVHVAQGQSFDRAAPLVTLAPEA
jgi:acetyl/propionyl-CoA carboxylase alpha subunit